jgi:broad specificity phosphatase PhoE
MSSLKDLVIANHTVTRWWHVRHAPVPNPEGRMYGQTDKDADVSDEEGFAMLAQQLPHDAVLVTSALKRTHQTADAILAKGLTIAERHQFAAFNEQSFGDWQGMTYEELWHGPGERHPFWLAPTTKRAPNGESYVDLMDRVMPCIRELTERFAGRDIIAVTHGGTIRAALALALGLDSEQAVVFSTDNIAVTRIDHYAGEDERAKRWHVAWVNRPPVPGFAQF